MSDASFRQSFDIQKNGPICLNKNEYCLKQTYEELLLILGAKRVIATG